MGAITSHHERQTESRKLVEVGAISQNQSSQHSFRRRRATSSSTYESPSSECLEPYLTLFFFPTAAYSSPVHDEADLKSLASPPAPLTRANLELLAKMTNSQGPKSNNNTTTASDSQTKNSKESRVSITDPTFEPKLRQNGVQRVTASYRRPPVNLDEMERRLRQSRKTASPTPEEHLLYSRYFDNATNKRDIENALGHFVLKQPEATLELSDTRYVSHIDKQWVDFPKDVGLNNQLSAPKPDRVEGFAQDTFPPDIDRLGGAAMLVKNNPRFVALPHFVGEFKDFGGDMRKAQVQAAYDGAAMVYARNEALKLVQQPDPERTAAPITVTSDGCDWKTYVHYSGTNQDTGKLEYYQVRGDWRVTEARKSDNHIPSTTPEFPAGDTDPSMFPPLSSRLLCPGVP